MKRLALIYTLAVLGIAITATTAYSNQSLNRSPSDNQGVAASNSNPDLSQGTSCKFGNTRKSLFESRHNKASALGETRSGFSKSTGSVE